MGLIAWTDGEGSATLVGLYADEMPGAPVVSRFDAWIPRATHVGVRRRPLAGGAPQTFTFRMDYGVAFTLPDIPAASMPLMVRLAAHLVAGGVVTVQPEDALGASYACCLDDEGDAPTIDLTNKVEMLYSMRFALVSVDGVPLVCIYE